MNPAVGQERIVSLSFLFDFSCDIYVVSNLILLRSFSVPRVSLLLDATAVFYRLGEARSAALARAVAQLVAHGYDSASGRAIIQWMIKGHGRYDGNNKRDLMAPDPPELLEKVALIVLRCRTVLCRRLPPRKEPFRPFMRLVESCPTH